MVYSNAFYDCPSLDHSNIIATGKICIGMFREFARADLFRRMGTMNNHRKATIGNKVDNIPNQIICSGRGHISQEMKDNLAKIHGLITFWELKEPLTILELAIWKLSLIGAENDVECRQHQRKQCGRDMQVIMSGVLQFFEYNTEE